MMQRAFGLEIPQSLEDVCDPARLALLVYDMQAGIVSQIKDGREITDKVVQVLEAARAAGFRVFFTRHMSLPRELMGVFQFRMAMAWQRVKSVDEVKPWFLRNSPGFHRASPAVLVRPFQPSKNLECERVEQAFRPAVRNLK